MSGERHSLNVLGVEVGFKPTADMERVTEAARLVEERFAVQQERTRGVQSKDILLTQVALGLADEVLQAQKERDCVRSRIDGMLSRIDGAS